ncbi:MAG: radical SAM protein, partial [Bacteroidales bacterium]|nr:radical SAM protein [Bacteroidales bacterium]
LESVGRAGSEILKLKPEDFIELPEGSDFFQLPGRKPLGFNPKTNEFEICEKGSAVAAFVAPAYTQLYFSAYEKRENAVILPLYAYTTIGWLDNKFYTTAIRIDDDIRQDCNQFNQKIVIRNAGKMIKANPKNRLLEHIGHCATVYFCPAARNYFLKRWEMPLPTSPACNSNCLGCISYQPEENKIKSTQNRIEFIPTVDEIVEIAVPHLENAPEPVVSFGQGCEGEPLLVWKVIRDAIKEIRKKTNKGIINLNTNGSKPNAVEELFKVGLDSIRVSLNSSQKELYNKYYLPVNYSFEDVIESMKTGRKYKKWVSINYFTFPGITDSADEFEELKKILKYTDASMIQWRNFNIDPDWYIEKIGIRKTQNILGIKNLMDKIKKEFPDLTYGYFNPSLEKIKKNGHRLFANLILLKRSS